MTQDILRDFSDVQFELAALKKQMATRVTGLSSPLVTALPPGPSDDQRVTLQTAAMAAQGVAWALRYRAAAPGPYRWECLGGNDMVFSAGSVTGVTSTAANGLGAAFVVPVAGNYILEVGSGLIRSNTGAAYHGLSFYADGVSIFNATYTTGGATGSSIVYRPASTFVRFPSEVLQVVYQMASGTNSDFYNCYARLRPLLL